MAEVRPFQGLRFGPERVGDISCVICPPYDIIAPEEKALYYFKSPFNMVRLEFGFDMPQDNEQNNKYTRADATLKRWLQEGILIREGSPVFYIIEHRFPFQDSARSRWALLARLRLEPLGQGMVLPHEVTMKEPAIDRLRLLEASQMNFSPIMGLYRNEGEPFSLRDFVPGEPLFHASDTYGVDFRLWKIGDKSAIQRLQAFFTPKVIYIADGHHRYETAFHYREERRRQEAHSSGEEGFNFVLASLADAADSGMVVHPTHRLVRGLEPEKLEGLKRALEAYPFATELLAPYDTLSDTMINWLEALKERGGQGTAFGVYGLHGEALCLASVRERAGLQEGMPRSQPLSWKELDVSLLHWGILRNRLGIDNPEKEKNHLAYTRDALEAVSLVSSGSHQVAFLLNATGVESVLAVADSGTRMPQKSTYFYPKTPAGLVLNPLFD